MRGRNFQLFWLYGLFAGLLLCVPMSAQDTKRTQGKDKGEARSFLSQNKPFTAARHTNLGLQCADCHGDADHRVLVQNDKCLVCHESFEELAKKTEDLKPNPHRNHLVKSGAADCVSCHRGHRPNVIYCSACHENMTFVRKAATTAK